MHASGGDASMQELTNEEQATYSHWYEQIVQDDQGIPGQAAVPFFERSGLPRPQLREIWDKADPFSTGILGRLGFYHALKLIACAQHNIQPDSLSLLSTRVPLPVFTNNVISREDLEKYKKIFDACHPKNGRLDRAEAKAVLMRSNLGEAAIDRIQQLATASKSATSISQTDFLVAMYYIKQCMSGKNALPDTVPAEVRSAAASIESPLLSSAVPSEKPMVPDENTVTLSDTTWQVPEQDMVTYLQAFRGIQVAGFDTVDGKRAVDYFSQSKLPQEILAEIWDLADTGNRGNLTFVQFILANCFIYHCLAGKPLPQTLPPQLVEHVAAFCQSETTLALMADPRKAQDDRIPALQQQVDQLEQEEQTLTERIRSLELQLKTVRDQRQQKNQLLDKYKKELSTATGLTSPTRNGEKADKQTAKMTPPPPPTRASRHHSTHQPLGSTTKKRPPAPPPARRASTRSSFSMEELASTPLLPAVAEATSSALPVGNSDILSSKPIDLLQDNSKDQPVSSQQEALLHSAVEKSQNNVPTFASTTDDDTSSDEDDEGDEDDKKDEKDVTKASQTLEHDAPHTTMGNQEAPASLEKKDEQDQDKEPAEGLMHIKGMDMNPLEPNPSHDIGKDTETSIEERMLTESPEDVNASAPAPAPVPVPAPVPAPASTSAIATTNDTETADLTNVTHQTLPEEPSLEKSQTELVETPWMSEAFDAFATPSAMDDPTRESEAQAESHPDPVEDNGHTEPRLNPVEAKSLVEQAENQEQEHCPSSHDNTKVDHDETSVHNQLIEPEAALAEIHAPEDHPTSQDKKVAPLGTSTGSDHDFEVVDTLSSSCSFVSASMDYDDAQKDFDAAFSNLTDARVVGHASSNDSLNDAFQKDQVKEDEEDAHAQEKGPTLLETHHTSAVQAPPTEHLISPSGHPTNREAPLIHDGFAGFPFAGTIPTVATTSPPSKQDSSLMDTHSSVPTEQTPAAQPTHDTDRREASPVLSEFGQEVIETVDHSMLKDLVNMGFSVDQAKDALKRYDNDLQKATNFLLDQSN